MNETQIQAPPKSFHLSLETSDLPGSRAHYARVLGAEPSVERADYVRFEVTDPPLVLTLVPGRQGMISHMGVRIEDPGAYASERDRLAQAGVVASEEQGETCCYAVQDKVWMHDPDGRPFETYHKRDDALEANSAKPTAGQHSVPAAPGAGCCAPPPKATGRTAAEDAGTGSTCC